jgi:hypothetical protein
MQDKKLNADQVKWLENRRKDNCAHASNMLAKAEKGDSSIGLFFDEYKKFWQVSQNNDIGTAVEGLNTYKSFVAKHAAYTAQSKFDSTILEEFVCQLLKKRFDNDVLKYGAVKAYSNLYFSYSGKNAFKEGADIKVNVKNQDIGIYKEQVLQVLDNEGSVKQIINISVPIVCIECKTYLDKTMYEGSVATADKIKSGNPHCLFFIVTETYDVSKDVEVETSNIDNIYVVRKQRRLKGQQENPADPGVFRHLIETIEEQLETERPSIDDMIVDSGYIRRKNKKPPESPPRENGGADANE